MAHEIRNTLWASDDGSFGNGEIVTVDTAKWTKKQWSWFERLEDGGEVYSEDLISIDNNIKPEF